MSVQDWAKREVELACKRENPNWDGKSFDYGCSCYQSALKAYNSLCEDDHSGFSWGITRNILIRLMNDLPLTPINDEDFFIENDLLQEDERTLKERGLKSVLQCPRMTSLFRYESLDGKVTYSDVERYYIIDKNGHSWINGKARSIIDEMFPITMPYIPPVDKYVVYSDSFLVDAKNGDYDHEAFTHLITPDGKRVELDEYYKEINGKMVKITKEEYFRDKEKAIG